ncbi:MAG: hypothetical protein KBB32_06735 [Spirochaetia bacterium]|nr:hypothetical protein [Spirochaetia bacterium]
MRTRTIIIALALILLVAVPSSFGLGIGAAFGLQPLNGLPGSNVMLSLKLSELPFLMGVGFTLGEAQTAFGFTADWWMANDNLFSFFNYYIGLGFYLGYSQNLLLGGRLPIGLNVFPIKNLELFLEIAPTLAAEFGDPIRFPAFGVQGAFGLRFWF